MFTGRVVGDCPGYHQDLSAVGFMPVQCDQSQLLNCDNDHNAFSSADVDEALSSSIAAPTVSEMCEALRMGGTVDMSNPAECFRVPFFQNSVMLREAIVSRRFSKKSSGETSFSSLTGSGESSGRASVGSNKRTKLAPPKVFRCPCCPAILNEKDFGRHVEKWVDKLGKRVASGDCPGIQDEHHPLLQQFRDGSLQDRVSACSRDIRSLLHPGAYDALSPEGSGRHVIVAQRIAELMQP